jgi:hypothetical protein
MIFPNFSLVGGKSVSTGNSNGRVKMTLPTLAQALYQANRLRQHG